MAKRILVTDTLFVYSQHEQRLEAAGYEVIRLDKPAASEDELIAALPGIHGYILGGVERVTERVIAAADQLEAIAFTGSGYSEFIPAHEVATRRGIAISAATGVNARAVAEYTITLMLAAIRRLIPLSRSGGSTFYTAPGLQELTLGVVGYGHIGQSVAKLARGLGLTVVATSRSKREGTHDGIEFMAIEKMLPYVDVVSLHVDKLNGEHVLRAQELSILKDGAIVLNTAFPDALDQDALKVELENGRLTAAFDAPPNFSVSSDALLASNAQTAFNTSTANQAISDHVTESLINLLSSGSDAGVVNPEFRAYRSVSHM